MPVLKLIRLSTWSVLALLSACGGGQQASELSMPTATEQRAVCAAMAQPGPGMATLLEQPRQAAAAPVTSTRLVKAQAANADAASTVRRPDLIWFNAKTGHTVSWTMDGLRGVASQSLLQSPDWRLTFVADVNGDGQDDYVWENATSGQIAVWIMNGPTIFDVSEIRVLLQERGWKVTHVADFNGDDRDDLLLRNDATGQTVMWVMNGATVQESAVLLTDTESRVLVASDLDGDGMADLVWDNRREDNVYSTVWWMKGTQGLFSAKVPSWKGRFFPSAAAVTGGAGNDLVFSSDTSFLARVLQVSPQMTLGGGWAVTSEKYLPAGGIDVLAAADLSGAGRAALIWRDRASGLSYAAEYVPGAEYSWRMHWLTADPDWQLEQAADLDGDGRTDLVWRHTRTGQFSAALMDGIYPKAESGLMTDPDWRVIGVRAAGKPPLARIQVPPAGLVGEAMTLDGSASQSRNGAVVKFVWTVLSRPEGSVASLSDASAAQPRFTPDQPGTYQFQLVAQAAGQSSKAAVAVSTVGIKAAPAARPLTIEPVVRVVNARTYLNFPFQLVDGLVAGHSVYVEVPSAFSVLDADGAELYPKGRFKIERQERLVRVKLLDRPTRWPGGSWPFPEGFRLEVLNPAAAGVYTFKVSTDIASEPVSVPVRIAAIDTQPAASAVFSDVATIGSGTTALSLDVSSPVGLPVGSRLFVETKGLGTRGARLASNTDAVDLETQPGLLIFTVRTPAAAGPGGRLTAEDLRVDGLSKPLCAAPQATALSVWSTEDTVQLRVDGPSPGVGSSRIESAIATAGAYSDKGNLNWSLSFVAPRGLPTGAKVLIKLPLELDVFNEFGRNTNSDVKPDYERRCIFYPYGDTGYRSVEIPAGAAVAPGGRFDSRIYMSFLMSANPWFMPRPGSSYDIEVYTTEDSQPVNVKLVAPPR